MVSLQIAIPDENDHTKETWSKAFRVYSLVPVKMKSAIGIPVIANFALACNEKDFAILKDRHDNYPYPRSDDLFFKWLLDFVDDHRATFTAHIEEISCTELPKEQEKRPCDRLPNRDKKFGLKLSVTGYTEVPDKDNNDDKS